MQRSLLKRYSYLKYLLLMLPTLVVWFVLTIYPNLEVFVLSLFKWNGISRRKTYVGFQNFQTIFYDPNFKDTVRNTLLYVLFLFLVQTVLSVVLTMVLRRNTSHSKFFRTLFFLPLVLSSVTVGLTWSYMYDPNLGILNNLFTSLGLSGFNGFDWLAMPGRAIFFIVMVHIWANIGYPITILTAGLQTIPETLYEAATVEGATSMQTFRGVTLPLLMPTLLRLTLLTFSTGAMAFDYILLMGSTGQRTPFDTWSVGIYKGLNGTNLGISAANGVLLAFILFAVFAIQYVVTRRVEESVN